MAGATLDLVTYDNARLIFPVLCLEDRTILTDDLGCCPAEQLAADTTIFQRKSQPAGDIYPDTALLLSTSGSICSPKRAQLSCSGLADNTAVVCAFRELIG